MQKTKIPWANYTINSVKGLCPVGCKDNQGKSYCYARRMYKRFKWNPEIRFDKEVPMYGFPASSKVFVGSTIELFGNWIKEDWLKTIFANVRQSPDVTFIFLTKQPQNLPKEFPDNCWVGVSTPNAIDAIKANKFMPYIQAKIKFLSIEPMFYWNLFPRTLEGILYGYNWLILGSQTQPVRHPAKNQVFNLLEAAQELHIPVFLKSPLAEYMGIERKEYPR